jgi:4-amino-4-deoxy-L-arabinose transferase-like glycosyltransferase
MQENTKKQSQIANRKSQIIWIFFAALIVAVYFFGLTIPLLGPDEPRYSQVAREMFERGDWVTPTLGGYDWFEKPALLYWLQIAFYNLFGVSEFAARCGSALFGLGTIASLWILGKFTAETQGQGENEATKTEDRRPKTEFANWLALIAASSIGLIVFSRGASFDIILTFPITASLVGFFIFDLTERKQAEVQNVSASPRRRVAASLFAFYFFIGVALLAKGLVGIVFPFAIVAFYYVLSRRFPPKTFIVSLFWGTILSLLVAAAWYVPMYRANGWKFVDEFFIQHHFQRYTSNKYLHPQPFWFFFAVLPLMTVPWLPFFLASIWKAVKGFFQRRDAETQRKIENNSFRFLPFPLSPLLLFSFSWLLVPLVFFSASGSKLPGYILPALPAAAILTAVYVYEFAQKSETRRKVLQILAFLTFAVVAVLLQFFVEDFAHRDSTKNLVRTGNENGFADAKILTLHTISHNLEFYGAGRLARLPDGKQRYFYGVAEVAEYIRVNERKPVLVLVPLERLKELTESELVAARVLGDNAEKALVAVNLK